MRELQFDLSFPVGTTDVHLVHGSPRKVNEYLFDKPARLYERLAGRRERPGPRVGHTHKPWVHEYGGVLFVNCGSVGKRKDGNRAPPSRSSAPLPARSSTSRSSASTTTPKPSPTRSPNQDCRPSTPRSELPRRRVTAPLSRRLLAELLGSAFLAATVVGSGIAAQQLSPGDTGLQLLENAAATAAGLFAFILMFGPVSGAHFNPVVSLVDAWFGGLSWRQAFAYIPAQVLGCIAGAIAANLMFDLAAVSISEHPSRVRCAPVLGGHCHARAAVGDLLAGANAPHVVRASRRGCLHRRGLLLHQLDELRQSRDHHRPRLLGHVRRNCARGGSRVHRRSAGRRNPGRWYRPRPTPTSGRRPPRRLSSVAKHAMNCGGMDQLGHDLSSSRTYGRTTSRADGAIVQEGYGEIDSFGSREIEIPDIGDDEVLVSSARSVHPDVWHVVRGRPYVLRLMGAGLRRPRCRCPRD